MDEDEIEITVDIVFDDIFRSLDSEISLEKYIAKKYQDALVFTIKTFGKHTKIKEV